MTEEICTKCGKPIEKGQARTVNLLNPTPPHEVAHKVCPITSEAFNCITWLIHTKSPSSVEVSRQWMKRVIEAGLKVELGDKASLVRVRVPD